MSYPKAKITFLIILEGTIRGMGKARRGRCELKFKTEIFMLLTAIVLFTISTYCYSFTLSLSYPYRSYAIPIVSFGSILMATATISYSKRSKNCV